MPINVEGPADRTIVAEKAGSNVICYLFDENGDRFGFEYNGSKYVCLFNAQGDVVAIVNSSNQLVAKYAYDAWGKLLNTDSDSPAPAVVNSIRYGILIHQRNTTALLNVAGHHPLQLE